MGGERPESRSPQTRVDQTLEAFLTMSLVCLVATAKLAWAVAEAFLMVAWAVSTAFWPWRVGWNWSRGGAVG